VVLYGGESAVVTTSARFYVSVALQSRLQIQHDFSVQLPSISTPSVFVHSPQFDVIYAFTLLPPHDHFFRFTHTHTHTHTHTPSLSCHLSLLIPL
jgi:hypothetical protein